MVQIDEDILKQIESQHKDGLTSAEILDVFGEFGIPLSEATLRKYVQLGLLPRSVRVGRKGKHRGSQGMYPVSIIRQVLQIKEMMAQSYTIEEIQKEFLFIRSDLQQLERTLEGIFKTLDEALKHHNGEGYTQVVARDVKDARSLSKDLLARLGAIESRLISDRKLERMAAS